MNNNELKILTTDISAGVGPVQSQALKGFLLAIFELIDEGTFSCPVESREEYESIGKSFVAWAKEVKVGAQSSN